MYGDSEESLQYKASAIPQYKKTKIRIKLKKIFCIMSSFLYKVMFLSFNNHSPPQKKGYTRNWVIEDNKVYGGNTLDWT